MTTMPVGRGYRSTYRPRPTVKPVPDRSHPPGPLDAMLSQARSNRDSRVPHRRNDATVKSTTDRFDDDRRMELNQRTLAYTRAREAAEAIPREHLPIRRLRFVIALGLLPMLWVLPRCRHTDCRKAWPCPPLLRQLRRVHGWTADIDIPVKALSSKRNRARAARRNPTAVSHRAVPERQWWRREVQKR
jgi:hypothetical protein